MSPQNMLLVNVIVPPFVIVHWPSCDGIEPLNVLDSKLNMKIIDSSPNSLGSVPESRFVPKYRSAISDPSQPTAAQFPRGHGSPSSQFSLSFQLAPLVVTYNIESTSKPSVEAASSPSSSRRNRSTGTDIHKNM